MLDMARVSLDIDDPHDIAMYYGTTVLRGGTLQGWAPVSCLAFQLLGL